MIKKTKVAHNNNLNAPEKNQTQEQRTNQTIRSREKIIAKDNEK